MADHELHTRSNQGDVAEAVADACRHLPGWPALQAPAGYPDSMALCLIDAIWSMGVKYQGVVNVLNRYRSWLDSSDRGATDRSARELFDDIAHVGGPEAFAKIVKNRGRTSTRSGVLKAQAVSDAAQNLVGVGVDNVEELRLRSADPDVERAYCSTPGQSSGISWHYLCILAGVEDVKADRMICRFVAAAAGLPTMTSSSAHHAVLDAHTLLKTEAPTLTLRALDHGIWSSQRGRAAAQ